MQLLSIINENLFSYKFHNVEEELLKKPKDFFQQKEPEKMSLSD